MDDAQRSSPGLQRTGRQITVRLIKGAYWDYEVINAEKMVWPVPVWTAKYETDACFERMAEMFVEAMPRSAGQGGVKLALGSHNIRSIAYSLALLEKHGLPESALEVQQLHGMADQLQAALISRGLRIREYVPVGQMIPGMAYFVRRLLENTSNQSWLRAGFSDEVSDDVLLASPHEMKAAACAPATTGGDAAQRHKISPAVEGLGGGLPMINEPVHDFSQAGQREAFLRKVAEVKVPAVKQAADAENARQAIAKAAAAFPAWRDMDPIERSNIIIKAAAILRNRRDEAAAIMIREAGKPCAKPTPTSARPSTFANFTPAPPWNCFGPNAWASLSAS